MKERPHQINMSAIRLGSVCKLKNGYAFRSSKYSKQGIPVIRISDIKDGEVSISNSIRIPPDKSFDEFTVEHGDILIAMSGATTGKFGIYNSKEKAYQNQRVGKFKIISDEVLNRNFLFYQLHALKRKIEKDAYGGAQPNISSKKIEELEISIAALPEQHLIVSKIEELFSELDKGIEQLKTAQQQLKVYRHAVLKYAFEGKLTNKDVKEGELPKGWKWVKFNEIGKWTGGGTPSKQNQKFWTNGNVLWVSPKDMKLKIIGDTQDKITKESIEESSAKWIQSGSILFVVRSGIIRRTLPIAIAGKDLTTNQDLQSLTLYDANPSYVYWYCVSKEQAIREECAKDGTTVDNLEVPKLKAYPICICSKDEQEFIVQEIESRLSVCDKLEETINNSLKQADALRQSILKNAFEGRLLSENEFEGVHKLAVAQADLSELPIAAEPKVAYKRKGRQSQIHFPKVIEGITTTDLHAGILAMIIEAHASPEHQPKLSHVKGEKIAHLVEAHIGIDLGRVPKKDAAGPDDYPHLKKVESRANKANWFGVKKLKIGHTYVVKPGLPRIIGKVKEVLPSEELQKIESLIHTFLPFELEHAEVIATVYAAWNNLLLEGKKPTDEEIVYESRENWSERKLTIEREKFFKALKWMREHQIIPVGKGKKVY